MVTETAGGLLHIWPCRFIHHRHVMPNDFVDSLPGLNIKHKDSAKVARKPTSRSACWTYGRAVSTPVSTITGTSCTTALWITFPAWLKERGSEIRIAVRNEGPHLIATLTNPASTDDHLRPLFCHSSELAALVTAQVMQPTRDDHLSDTWWAFTRKYMLWLL